MMLPVLSNLSELYRAADGAAIACLLAKLGVEKSLTAKLEDTRQALMVSRLRLETVWQLAADLLFANGLHLDRS